VTFHEAHVARMVREFNQGRAEAEVESLEKVYAGFHSRPENRRFTMNKAEKRADDIEEVRTSGSESISGHASQAPADIREEKRQRSSRDKSPEERKAAALEFLSKPENEKILVEHVMNVLDGLQQQLATMAEALRLESWRDLVPATRELIHEGKVEKAGSLYFAA